MSNSPSLNNINQPSSVESSIRFEFDPEKALEIILYIAENSVQKTILYISTILYQADKLHLSKYGRFICGDSYIATNNGPIPSGVYSILTSNNNCFKLINSFNQNNQLTNYIVKPLRTSDIDSLSESDLKCLDETIKQCNTLSFSELIEKNHNELLPEVKLDQEIPIELIIKQLANSDDVFDYLAG